MKVPECWKALTAYKPLDPLITYLIMVLIMKASTYAELG